MNQGSNTSNPSTLMHDVLRKLAQQMYDENGIVMRRVDFEWVDVGTLNKMSMRVGTVSVDSETRGNFD